MKLEIIHNGQIKQIEKSNINVIRLVSSANDANKVALINLIGEKSNIGYRSPLLINLSGNYQNSDQYESLVKDFAKSLNLFYEKNFSGIIINLDNVKKIKEAPFVTVKRNSLVIEITFNDNSNFYIYAKNNKQSKAIIKQLINKFENSKNFEINK